jgi:hypothetical protein
MNAKTMFGCSTLLLWIFLSRPLAALAAEVNYDEAKVGNYTLPDPLRLEDGRWVTNASMWLRLRRPEILEQFQREVYGRFLPRPAEVRFLPMQEPKPALEGRAIRRDIQMEITGAFQGTAMTFTLYLPSNANKPAPIFLGVHLFDTAREYPLPAVARRLPGSKRPTEAENVASGRQVANQILERGYGLASVNIQHLAPDSATNYQSGVLRLLGRAREGVVSPDESGALGVWAWGLSRVLDYLETLPEVNARRVVVIGHSRMGKTALWAAAHDERFAIAIANCSGCAGAALSRRNYGETLAIITQAFPFWFGGRLAAYANRVDALPVDQHELIALIAPRPVYIASAVEDRWADPKGEFLAAWHAEPVYQLLNAGGLGVATQPAADHPVGDTIGYHLRSGQHDLTDYDWQQYLHFVDRQFGRLMP